MGNTDTLNAISTALGVAALVPGPHSLICGGLSIMVGLIGAAYSDSESSSEPEYDYDYGY